MIEINLVPEEISQRKKRKAKQVVPTGFSIPIETIIAIVGGVFVLVIFIHIVLQTLIFVKFFSHGSLQNQSQALAPEKMKIDQVTTELRTLQQKVSSMKTIVPDSKVQWAELFNIISDSVPQELWLNKITLDQGLLVIDGSALSRKQNELISVHEFTSHLKNDAPFMNHFSTMDLESIQRKKIKGLDLADFSLTAKLK